MKVTLIFPPATDPRSPYLALPCLAAVLRREGVDTELLDLNIDGMLALLEPHKLEYVGEQLRERYEFASSKDRNDLKRLLGLSYLLPERINDALATFHDTEKFYNPNQFNTARETIFNCLDLVSSASLKQVHYNISPICYDVEGIDIQSMADLVKVTEDGAANLFADFWEREVFPQLNARSPDLIGITITNRQQVIPGLTLARQLRKQGFFVILGGAVYTKFSMKLLKLPAFFKYFADGIVVCEGEATLLELIYQLEGNRNFSKIPNFLYLRRGEVYSTRIHVENLNDLPTPDFTGLPLQRYLTPEPVLPIMFGKGCYYNRCKFCDIPYTNRFSKRSYRIRSPERVVNDLLELHRRFGCRHFVFTDETLAPRLLEKLADALEPYYEKGFCFTGYARLEPAFTSELCQKLARMGMRKLFFGLESGAQKTLDHMDKGIRISDVPVVLKNCRSAGINFHIFSIIGFPAESEDSARKTYQFFEENADIIDHPGNSFDIHPFGLELRTRYFEEAEKMGIQIDPETLTKEFIIGVGDHWTNTGDLTHELTETLLNEFQFCLQHIYRRYHLIDQQFWPAFEEFAVLYSDWYSKHEFPYRTSFSEDMNERCYRLRWNPASFVERIDENMLRVKSRYGQVDLDKKAYEILGSRKFRLIAEMLAEFGARNPSDQMKFLILQKIESLIAKDLLQIEPEKEV